MACRCLVTYNPVDGKVQNVHSKKWQDKDEYEKIKIRKELSLLTTSDKNDTIQIRKSLGAKAKNYDVKLPDGSYIRLTEGTRIENIETIAGKGRNRKVDIIDLLLHDHEGSMEDNWQKKKGIGYVDIDRESYKAELHWREEPTVGKVDFKVKE